MMDKLYPQGQCRPVEERGDRETRTTPFRPNPKGHGFPHMSICRPVLRMPARGAQQGTALETRHGRDHGMSSPGPLDYLTAHYRPSTPGDCWPTPSFRRSPA